MKRQEKPPKGGWSPGPAQGWMPLGGSVQLKGMPAPAVTPTRRSSRDVPLEPPPLRRRLSQQETISPPVKPVPPAGIRKIPVPEKPEIVAGKCPGAIVMPDGRTLEPGDSLTLKDFCEILPFIMEAMNLQKRVSEGFAPGKQLPLKGMPTRPSGTPISGPSQFGPTAGPAGAGAYPVQRQGGGGGGGFLAGGGGGRGQPGPQGVAGPPGPAGVTTTTGYIDHVLRTNGDFTAGPGSFIPVPFKKLDFSMEKKGTVVFFVHAALSAGAKVGIRVDGTDYEIASGNRMFPVSLMAGSYQAEVLLKGGTVSATKATPLALVAIHG